MLQLFYYYKRDALFILCLIIIIIKNPTISLKTSFRGTDRVGYEHKAPSANFDC